MGELHTPAPPEKIYPTLNECPSWISPKDFRIHDITLNTDPTGLYEFGEVTQEINLPPYNPDDKNTVVGVSLLLDRSQLPPCDMDWLANSGGVLNETGVPHSIGLSVRSCLAQSGLVIVPPYIAPVRIFQSPGINMETNEYIGADPSGVINRLSNDESVAINFEMINIGSTPIHLEKGDEICRAYYLNSADRVENMDLVNLVIDEGVASGIIGKDWGFMNTPDGLQGIWVSIADNQHIIKFDGPIRVTGRGELYDLQETIPLDAVPDQDFIVTSTKLPIHIPEGYIGELQPMTGFDHMNHRIDGHSKGSEDVFHINSLLLDPGADFVIRLEFYVRQLPFGMMPDRIFLALYRAPDAVDISNAVGTYPQFS